MQLTKNVNHGDMPPPRHLQRISGTTHLNALRWIVCSAKRQSGSDHLCDARLNVTPGPFQLVAQDAEKRDFGQESKLQSDLCPPDGNSALPRYSHWFATVNT